MAIGSHGTGRGGTVGDDRTGRSAELGKALSFSSLYGREGAPQRLLRHQAGSTHQLGGLRYAVDHVRPPSPPGRAGTRGYLEGQKTPRIDELV